MSEKRAYRRFAIYSSIIFILPSTLLGGFFLGYLADRQLDTSPWLAIAGLFVGIIGAFVQLFQILTREKGRNSGEDG